MQVFGQLLKEQRKFLCQVKTCSSGYNEDDTCAVFYATKENFDARKIKNAYCWKDPKLYKKDAYAYTRNFLNSFTDNGTDAFNEILHKNHLLDTTDSHQYSIRNLEAEVRLKRLKSTSIRLFNPEFNYDFILEIVISTKLNPNIITLRTAKISPFTKLNRFNDIHSEIVTKENIARHADSLMGVSFMDLFSKENVLKIEKKIDSIIASRTNVKPISLTIVNKLLPSKMSNYINSVVTVKLDDGHGSGCIVSDDGYIITNYHVVDTKTEASVIFNDGTTKTATVIRTNPEEDLALLKMEGTGYKPFIIKPEDEYLIGTEVFAIGTPADVELGQTVSKGIISGMRKLFGGNYIQMDIKINPGNSGGALIYKTGELIGVINAKMIGSGIEGIGFSIPAKKVLSSLVLTYK